MGCVGFASVLPATVYAQDADVIDSYPKEVLKQRAAKRKAEREAAAAAEAVVSASETAPDPVPVSEITPDSVPVSETAPEPVAVSETTPDPVSVSETTSAVVESENELVPEPTSVSEALPAVEESGEETASTEPVPAPVIETIRDDPAFVNETVPAHLQSATETAETETVSASAAVAPGPVVAGSSPMGIDMVVINPGTGILGSPDSEEKRARFENPLRNTSISYKFEVSKYEITFDDWAKCLKDGGCAGHKPDDKEWGRGKRPVIDVSFNDAKNFVKWLNKKTGETYRLLSEVEWEYVARAGQTGPFGTGNGISSKDANFDGKAPYGAGAAGPYLRKTQPVGQYEPNAFGVYDMHGNVYEWVEDCWNADHTGAVGDGSPRTDGDCDFRVMKGGSWVTHGYQARAAARIRYVTDYRYDDYGIRIARTLN